MKVFRPASGTELAGWLTERAEAESVPIAVTGTDLERPPPGLDPIPQAVISTHRLGNVVEFRPQDLTITVGAGMRVSELARLVREEGLWFPLAECGTDRSAGGLVAAALPSAFDSSLGPVRRQVLACTIITRGGRRTRWGRAVMKNVAGYDLVRLACGSRGRLGVIITVTFRLWPCPPAARRVLLSGPHALTALLGDTSAPRCEGLTWRGEVSGDVGTAEATFIGSAASVAQRAAELERWADDRQLAVEPAGQAPGGTEPTPVARPPRPPTTASYRVTFGRGYLQAGVDDLRERLSGAETPGRLEAYLAGGVLCVETSGGLPAGRRPAPAWLLQVTEARGQVRGDPRLDEPAIRIDRGGPADYEAERRVRPAGSRHLEDRLLEALGGGEVSWQAEYL